MACSVLANSRSLAGESKIAPHSSCLLPKRPVGPFKFFDGHLRYILPDHCTSRCSITGAARKGKNGQICVPLRKLVCGGAEPLSRTYQDLVEG